MNIFVAGHKGMVGSSILRALKKRGYKNIITKNKKDLNLLDQNQTYKLLKKNKGASWDSASAKGVGIMSNINDPA